MFSKVQSNMWPHKIALADRLNKFCKDLKEAQASETEGLTAFELKDKYTAGKKKEKREEELPKP